MAHRQLVTPLPSEADRLAFAVSCSKDLERGARATLLLVEGLFRFDVVVSGDTLRTVVRNLSDGELEMHATHHNDPGTNLVTGEAVAYEPARAAIGFALVSEREQVDVKVTIGTMRRPDHGTLRVTAQGIVRQVDPQVATAET